MLRSDVRVGKGGTLLCDLAYDASPPLCEQTHACENITFLQLCLQAVFRQTYVMHPACPSGQCFVGFSSEQINSVICDILKL